MALHEFSLEALAKLDDGRVLEAWNQALKRAVADCHDRPANDAPRVVKLEMGIVPIIDDLGNLDTVRAAFVVTDAIPKRKSRIYEMLPRGKQMLAFNDLSDDNAHQRTLDEVGGFEDDGTE